jgi:hypothetical protein
VLGRVFVCWLVCLFVCLFVCVLLCNVCGIVVGWWPCGVVASLGKCCDDISTSGNCVGKFWKGFEIALRSSGSCKRTCDSFENKIETYDACGHVYIYVCVYMCCCFANIETRAKATAVRSFTRL